MNLTELSKDIYKANAAKGFWPKDPSQRNTGEALMLMTSELAEALEADRKGKHFKQAGTHMEEVNKMQLKQHLKDGNIKDFVKYFLEFQKDTFEDELADAIIRILDYCGGMEIDIQSHLELKLAYNRTREFKHGKKY